MLGKISGLGHFCDGTVSFSQKKLLSAIFKLFLCQKYLFKSPDFLKPVHMSIFLDISKKKINLYHNWKSNMADQANFTSIEMAFFSVFELNFFKNYTLKLHGIW